MRGQLAIATFGALAGLIALVLWIVRAAAIPREAGRVTSAPANGMPPHPAPVVPSAEAGNNPAVEALASSLQAVAIAVPAVSMATSSNATDGDGEWERYQRTKESEFETLCEAPELIGAKDLFRNIALNPTDIHLRKDLRDYLEALHAQYLPHLQAASKTLGIEETIEMAEFVRAGKKKPWDAGVGSKEDVPATEIARWRKHGGDTLTDAQVADDIRRERFVHRLLADSTEAVSQLSYMGKVYVFVTSELPRASSFRRCQGMLICEYVGRIIEFFAATGCLDDVRRADLVRIAQEIATDRHRFRVKNGR